MSAFEGYNGQAYSLSGDKGRYVLPPAFRNAIKDSSDGTKTLCLAAHDKFDCLIGFSVSRIPELRAKLDKEEQRAIDMKDYDWDRDVRAQQLFGFEQIPFDDSGRFNMPDHLRDLGNVGDGLYFHGAGDFFFIWNPEELDRMDRNFRGAQATCRKLKAEAEVKAKSKGKGGKK